MHITHVSLGADRCIKKGCVVNSPQALYGSFCNISRYSISSSESNVSVVFSICHSPAGKPGGIEIPACLKDLILLTFSVCN